MVLSNKKLKQKIRAAKAQLIVASEAQNNFAEKNSQNSHNPDSKTLHSLSAVLNPEAQKPRLSKREKRRQKAQKENPEIIKKDGEIIDDAEGNKQDGSKIDNLELKKKKRKRDESEAPDNVKEKKPKQLKKKKNAKNKKKSKKKVANGNVKEEGIEQNDPGTTGLQIVAKTNMEIDRKDAELSDKVYVGGIPYYSTEDDIRSFFESCGTITSVDCMTFPDTGKFRGIAIITFKTEAAAKRALALDGSDMGGLFLKIQPFKSAKVNKSSNFSPSVLEGYNRIYIGNLSWDITEDDLRKLFADCKITSIRFGEDKETAEFKGYAHVDFADSLSLNMALKLDQKIVCGRPVRISCAVPKKGTVTKLQSMPNDNQVDTGNASAGDESQINNAVSSKIRRRTCYDCGAKGHLSSSCPKTQAADLTNPKDNAVCSMQSMEEEPVIEPESMPRDDQAVSSKIRRRTCYECGEKGHLSSSCPKTQAADSKSPKDNDVSSMKSAEEETVFKLESKPRDDQVDSGKVGAVDQNQGINTVSSKIRRRTCYECGEKGHLSSSCPKAQAADSTNPKYNAVSSLKSMEETVTKLGSMPRDDRVNGGTVSAVNENRVDSSAVKASKIRRRTCYECGEKGHLSSSCPKNQAADSTNPGAT